MKTVLYLSVFLVRKVGLIFVNIALFAYLLSGALSVEGQKVLFTGFDAYVLGAFMLLVVIDVVAIKTSVHRG